MCGPATSTDPAWNGTHQCGDCCSSGKTIALEHICVADGGHSGDGHEHLVNYEAFKNAEELLPAGKLPTIEELPIAEELQRDLV